MINLVKGDLFTTKDVVILHSTNCRGAYASGVAGAIRKKYPEAYNAYMKEFNENGLTLGNVTYAWVDSHTRVIANCNTQENYGGLPGVVYCDYRAIYTAVKKAMEYAKKLGQTSVSMPAMSMALAGGDPEKVILSLKKASEVTKVNINMYIIDVNLYEEVKNYV